LGMVTWSEKLQRLGRALENGLAEASNPRVEREVAVS
jgi:hypothetical protein